MNNQMKQEILDTLFYSTNKECRKSMHHNEIINSIDEEKLYGIMDKIRLEEDGIVEVRAKFDEAINDIVSVLDNIGHSKAGVVRIGKKTKPISSKSMPLLVRQIMFFLCYMGFEYKNKEKYRVGLCDFNQNFLLNEINKRGYSLGHNTWQDWGMRPEDLYNMRHHVHSVNPSSYKGQKTGALGYAINNLVYQAGTYKCYVDIFGGSACASTAVSKRKKSKYIYNELNYKVKNYIEVIKDDKLYKLFIEELMEIQRVIADEEFDVTFRSKIFDESQLTRMLYYYTNRKGQKTDTSQRRKDIFNAVDSEYDYSEIKEILTQYYDVLYNQYDYLVGMGVIDCLEFKDRNSIKNINIDNCFMDFFDDKKYGKMVEVLKAANLNKKGYEKLSELLIKEVSYIQFKALSFYSYFYQLDKTTNYDYSSDSNKVKMALALFYLYYFSFESGKDKNSDSKITKSYADDGNKISNFINAKFEKKFNEFHDALGRVEIQQGDAFNQIKRYGADRRNIIYSDSPYVATSDYEDDGVSGFTTSDMQNLIDSLNQGQARFIFSCRACDPSGKISDKSKKNNGEIYKYSLKPFEKYKKNLYVLSVVTKNNVSDMLASNSSTEIMICNFKIREFEKYKSTTFAVHKFEDFMNIVNDNLDLPDEN